MTTIEQFPYRDRNPSTGGVDLLPDLPITLRRQNLSVTGIGLVDSGAAISVLPYSLGIQLGFDWKAQKAAIALGGTLASIAARGIVVEAAVGQLPTVRLAFAWAQSDHVPFLLGEFNFFEAFDVLLFRSRRIFEIRVPGASPVS